MATATRVVVETTDIPEPTQRRGYKYQSKCPINIPSDLHNQVKQRADADFRTISAVCTIALLEYLEK